MIVLSETTSNAMLDVLAKLMDGGSIELIADIGDLLAVLKLSNPATMPASNGELLFNDIAEEDSALAQGSATMAHILTVDGYEVFTCDVGDLSSDAVIKLNTTKIFRGGPVRLKSFKLAMP